MSEKKLAMSNEASRWRAVLPFEHRRHGRGRNKGYRPMSDGVISGDERGFRRERSMIIDRRGAWHDIDDASSVKWRLSMRQSIMLNLDQRHRA